MKLRNVKCELVVRAFDGRVIEIFGFGHKHASKRIHIDQLKAIIQESSVLTIIFEGGV